MSLLKEGSVVEFKDKKRVVTALCLKFVNKTTIRIINNSNKEFTLPITKIFNITDKVLDLSKQRLVLVDELNNFINNVEKISEEIELSDLWELLKDEEEKAYSIKELTDIYFGDNLTTHHYSAIFKILANDNTYFEQNKDNLFLPKTQKVVEQIILQRNIERQREEEKENALEWLRNFHLGKQDENRTDAVNKILNNIKEIIVLGSKSDKYNDGINLLYDIGLGDGDIIENAIEFLIKIGTFEKDQNLLLLEYNIPQFFSNSVLEDIKNMKINIENEQNRLDLRDIETITIDDEETKDIDDAISLKYTDDGFQIGIHIADAANFVQTETLLDKEAYSRSTTIYLPDKKIEMLPSILSEDICSLVSNQDRLAISVLINFDNYNKLKNYEIKETIINVDKRLSYKEADGIIETDPLLIKLLKVTRELKENRIQNGAIVFTIPELKIKVTEEREILIQQYKQNSQSQELVSELMIFANSFVAEYLYNNKIPCIYRFQDEPFELVDLNSDLEPIVLMFQQRRFMKKSEISIIPSDHCGLGLKFYTQMTSPIRRYSDLVIHRQLKAYLRDGQILYPDEKMKEVINFSEHSLNVANIIQRNGSRYWLMKYLSKFIKYKTPAIVLEAHDDRYFIQLTEFLFETPLFKELGVKLEVGQRIEVVIQDVKIRKGILNIRFAKESDSNLKTLLINETNEAKEL